VVVLQLWFLQHCYIQFVLSHLLYISRSVCNKCIYVVCTDARVNYAQRRNSSTPLLFTYLSLSCLCSLLHSNVSGTFNTEYIFNPFLFPLLSNELTAKAFVCFYNLFRNFLLQFLISLCIVFSWRSSCIL
jgi:hypothetical protein